MLAEVGGWGRGDTARTKSARSQFFCQVCTFHQPKGRDDGRGCQSLDAGLEGQVSAMEVTRNGGKELKGEEIKWWGAMGS